MEDRKSVFGYLFTLAGGAVALTSKKQITVVLSTMEAELIALNEAGKEAVFLCQLLQQLSPQHQPPVLINCDNLGTVQFSQNPQHHQRSKHVDVRYHYIRQLIEDNLVKIQHIGTKHMVADMLTKPLKPALVKPALRS